MSIDRKRLPSSESRQLALAAALELLVAEGPQAVTLKAVGAKIGRTHANLLHHFGSALELQHALAATLAENVCARIATAVRAARRGEADPRQIVDLTFNAFDAQGAGKLATWMIATGHRDALDPIMSAIHRLVDTLSATGGGDLTRPLKPDVIREATLSLVLAALGDALLGDAMTGALGLPRTAGRDAALRQLLAVVRGAPRSSAVAAPPAATPPALAAAAD